MIYIEKSKFPNKAILRIESFKNFLKLCEIINGVGCKFLVEQQCWMIDYSSIFQLKEAVAHLNEGWSVEDSIKEKLTLAERRTSLYKKLKSRIDNVKFTVKTNKPYRLFPFQKVGAAFLWLRKRALLADVVGLGKTIQALGAAEKNFTKGKATNVLIVCPNSLKRKWCADIEKFFGRKTFLIEGSKKKRYEIFRKFMQTDGSYGLISYDTLRSDVEYVKPLIQKYSSKSVGVICDEVQYIKNVQAMRSRVLYQISQLVNVGFIYGLSATYIENGLENIFGIFKVVDNKVFGNNFYRFEKRYLKLDSFGRVRGYKNVEEIEKKISTHVIRRHKEQVAEQLLKELPEIQSINYFVSLTPQQRMIYEDIREKIVNEITDPNKKMSVIRANAMTMMHHLSQACLSAELFDEERGDSTKISELMKIVEGFDQDSKVVIFCHFRKMTEIISRELNNAGYKAIYMHGTSEGGRTLNNRHKTIKGWAEGDARFLVTSDILAEGVDLIEASYLINFDLLWNPAKMQQRAGRIDRIGQKAKLITYINIITKSTVEESMFKRIEEKRELSEKVMDGGFESGRISKMTIDDIKHLINFKKKT